MKSDKITESLRDIRDRLFREQPDTMGALSDLIDLLEVVHCEHKFITKQSVPDSPDGPKEVVTVCEKCGIEKDD